MEPIPTSAHRLRPRAGGQAGVSLIEVLVGVAIMVPLTLASLSGMMVQARVSTEAERTQRLEVDLSASAEDLRAMTYLPCADADEYQKAFEVWREPIEARVAVQNAPETAKITRVDHWNAAKSAYVSDCTSDDGAQRLSIEIVGSDGSSTTGSVVKRDSDVRKAGSG